MKQLYQARDFFKSALLPNYSTYHDDSIGFVSESFVGAGGPLDRGSFRDVLVSVCTYRNTYLRLTLNEEMGCHNGICGLMRHDIARKFGINPDRIIMRSGRMRQAAPGYDLQIPDSILDPGQAIAHKSMSGYGTLGGYSINYANSTLGAIVSNNHVLANSNQARIGDGIYTRGIGQPRHIASLQHFVPIRFEGISNYLDLAAASVDNDVKANYYGPANIRPAQVGDRVTKVGATTQRTYGVVEALDETVYVKYGNRVAVFEDQMIIMGESDTVPFSKPGDSGSFIYGPNGNFVGLLFAGLGNETNANHATAVIQQLREWQIVR